MPKVVLCNAIAISMFSSQNEHTIRMVPMSENDARDVLITNGFEQAVGHPATADVLAARLGLDVHPNRMNVVMDPDTLLVVAQVVVPRLAEGQVLTSEEVESLPVQYWLVTER